MTALLVRSLQNVRAVDQGFDPAGVLAIEMFLSPGKYKDDSQIVGFTEQLQQRLAELAGVTSAGATTAVPGRPIGVNLDLDVALLGDSAAQRVRTELRAATGSYFSTMGIQLLAGSGFSPANTAGTPNVAVVSESLGRKLSSNNVLGSTLLINVNGIEAPYEIVGIVADVHQQSPDQEAKPSVYVPFAQHPFRSIGMVVRSESDLSQLAPLARAAVSSMDPDMALYSLQSLTEIQDAVLRNRRFAVTATASLGAVAILLAIAGVYGLMTMAVQSRESELGVRLALGASRRSVFGMVLSDSVVVVSVGVIVGAAASVATAQLLSSRLYGIGAMDVTSMGIAATLLVIASLIATAVPALRATAIDPVRLLRGDVNRPFNSAAR
jgi:putative ABC transport system permease protein